MSETKFTPGPWFVSGVRFRMNGGEWHSVNRYDEATKQDQNIACVGFDPRTGAGRPDAHLIAAAPAMFDALELAADTLHAFDEGDPTSETGWASDELLDAWIKAKAALAKARGEQ